MKRFFKILTIASVLAAFGLAGIAFAGRVNSTTEFMRDVSVGTWSAIGGITNSYTSGGTYTNGVYTNSYRIYGTNDLGRTPTGAVYTVDGGSTAG